jgi:hypothetical protein
MKLGKQGNKHLGSLRSQSIGGMEKREAGKPGSWEAGKLGKQGNKHLGSLRSQSIGGMEKREAGKPGSWEAMKLGKPGEQELGFASLTVNWRDGGLG